MSNGWGGRRRYITSKSRRQGGLKGVHTGGATSDGEEVTVGGDAERIKGAIKEWEWVGEGRG